MAMDKVKIIISSNTVPKENLEIIAQYLTDLEHWQIMGEGFPEFAFEASVNENTAIK
jgi:hypothetical protein